MTKILTTGLAVLALTLAVQQPAHAWSKFNFGIGMNIGFEGGGNSVLWGLLRGDNTPPGHFPGGFGGPGGYNVGPAPTPNLGGPAPLPSHAPAAEPEKLRAPAEVKPMGYYPYQSIGYYQAEPQTPAYPTHLAYPIGAPSYWYDR